jgi:hypothetical protein
MGSAKPSRLPGGVGSWKPCQVALRTRRRPGELQRERQVRELERKVGQLTLENEVLKNPMS